jgi:hypothetical protein
MSEVRNELELRTWLSGYLDCPRKKQYPKQPYKTKTKNRNN